MKAESSIVSSLARCRKTSTTKCRVPKQNLQELLRCELRGPQFLASNGSSPTSPAGETLPYFRRILGKPSSVCVRSKTCEGQRHGSMRQTFLHLAKRTSHGPSRRRHRRRWREKSQKWSSLGRRFRPRVEKSQGIMHICPLRVHPGGNLTPYVESSCVACLSPILVNAFSWSRTPSLSTPDVCSVAVPLLHRALWS